MYAGRTYKHISKSTKIKKAHTCTCTNTHIHPTPKTHTHARAHAHKTYNLRKIIFYRIYRLLKSTTLNFKRQSSIALMDYTCRLMQQIIHLWAPTSFSPKRQSIGPNYNYSSMLSDI